MTTIAAQQDLAEVDLSNLDLWREGPPHELFRHLREEEPLRWSDLGDFPDERGFWSVVRAEDITTVGRDHETFSSGRSIIPQPYRSVRWRSSSRQLPARTKPLQSRGLVI